MSCFVCRLSQAINYIFPEYKKHKCTYRLTSTDKFIKCKVVNRELEIPVFRVYDRPLDYNVTITVVSSYRRSEINKTETFKVPALESTSNGDVDTMIIISVVFSTLLLIIVILGVYLCRVQRRKHQLR